MYPQVVTQYCLKTPITALASNRCRFGSNVTGTACHCTAHCWFASCLQEQAPMCTSRKDHKCTGPSVRVSSSARRRGQEFPFRERRSIKLAIAWQCGRARNGWSAQSDQVFRSCRSANPGSLGTIGTIMRCNAAAGADEHDGCARIAAGAALGPNTPAPQVSIPMCTSRKHHGCAGRGKRISHSASSNSPCKCILSGHNVTARAHCKMGGFTACSSPHCICSL